MTISLSDRQRKYLRALAHPRRPVVMIGRNGLTGEVVREIGIALADHELIKVKVGIGDRDQRNEAVEAICGQTGAHLVQRIGHIATLYLPHPEKPVIELP